MPLKITVLPASSQAGKETISVLLNSNAPAQITAIYRNLSKAPEEFTRNPNFKAITGDVSGEASFDFSGADAVFYVPPPTYDGSDTAEFASKAAEKVKAALQKANVQRLMLFSAYGAQHDAGIGILKLNHITDQILKDSVPEVVITRPGWFMENWASAVAEIKASDSSTFDSPFMPLDYKIVMISTKDIAKFCAEHLLATGKALPGSGKSPYIFNIHGPREYSSNELRAALAQVMGKDVKVKGIEAGELSEYFKQGLPSPQAEEVTEMTAAMHPGGILAKDMEDSDKNIVRGTTELVDALRRLVSA